jgi:hypothetical protein
MGRIAAKSGKKNRKHGRNKEFCKRYKAENRRHKNKIKKLKKHIKKFPNEKNAVRVLKNL